MTTCLWQDHLATRSQKWAHLPRKTGWFLTFMQKVPPELYISSYRPQLYIRNYDLSLTRSSCDEKSKWAHLPRKSGWFPTFMQKVPPGYIYRLIGRNYIYAIWAILFFKKKGGGEELNSTLLKTIRLRKETLIHKPLLYIRILLMATTLWVPQATGISLIQGIQLLCQNSAIYRRDIAFTEFSWGQNQKWGTWRCNNAIRGWDSE